MRYSEIFGSEDLSISGEDYIKNYFCDDLNRYLEENKDSKLVNIQFGSVKLDGAYIGDVICTFDNNIAEEVKEEKVEEYQKIKESSNSIELSIDAPEQDENGNPIYDKSYLYMSTDDVNTVTKNDHECYEIIKNEFDEDDYYDLHLTDVHISLSKDPKDSIEELLSYISNAEDFRYISDSPMEILIERALDLIVTINNQCEYERDVLRKHICKKIEFPILNDYAEGDILTYLVPQGDFFYVTDPEYKVKRGHVVES